MGSPIDPMVEKTCSHFLLAWLLMLECSPIPGTCSLPEILHVSSGHYTVQPICTIGYVSLVLIILLYTHFYIALLLLMDIVSKNIFLFLYCFFGMLHCNFPFSDPFSPYYSDAPPILQLMFVLSIFTAYRFEH